MQIIIDESSSSAQRAALQTILTGGNTEEMATFWWVFAAMSPNKLETIYRPLEISIDLEQRAGRVSAKGVFETYAEPSLNPLSGEPHRARINVPNGFEFRMTEIARGTTRTTGVMEMRNNKDSHVHMVEIHINGEGVLEAAWREPSPRCVTTVLLNGF